MAARNRYPDHASGWIEERRANIKRGNPSFYKIYRWMDGSKKKSVYLKKSLIDAVESAITEGKSVVEVLKIVKGEKKGEGAASYPSVDRLLEWVVSCDASVDADRSLAVLAACCPATQHAFTEVIPYPLPISIAESMAVCMGFKVFRNAQKFYTDSKDTANAASRQGGTYYSDPNDLAGMLKHVTRCGSNIQWISRDKNKDPDGIARSVRLHDSISPKATAGKTMEWRYSWDGNSVTLCLLGEGSPRLEVNPPEPKDSGFYLAYEATAKKTSATIIRAYDHYLCIEKLKAECKDLDLRLSTLDSAMVEIAKVIPSEDLEGKIHAVTEKYLESVGHCSEEFIQMFRDRE